MARKTHRHPSPRPAKAIIGTEDALAYFNPSAATPCTPRALAPLELMYGYYNAE